MERGFLLERSTMVAVLNGSEVRGEFGARAVDR